MTATGKVLWRRKKGTPDAGRWISGSDVQAFMRTQDAKRRKGKVLKQAGIIDEQRALSARERSSVRMKLKWKRADRLRASMAELGVPMTRREAFKEVKSMTTNQAIRKAPNVLVSGWVAVRDDDGKVITDPKGQIATYRNIYSDETISGQMMQGKRDMARYHETIWWIAAWRDVSYAEARRIIKDEYGGKWHDALKGESPKNR